MVVANLPKSEATTTRCSPGYHRKMGVDYFVERKDFEYMRRCYGWIGEKVVMEKLYPKEQKAQ